MSVIFHGLGWVPPRVVWWDLCCVAWSISCGSWRRRGIYNGRYYLGLASQRLTPQATKYCIMADLQTYPWGNLMVHRFEGGCILQRCMEVQTDLKHESEYIASLPDVVGASLASVVGESG